LAGCPPLAGFFTKLLVIINVLEIAYYPIAFIIILTSVISACNYLSIIQIINIHPTTINRHINFNIMHSYFISGAIG
jgi:NADH:ubiquinone oxidoreductase subunit 2 (subunit N)